MWLSLPTGKVAAENGLHVSAVGDGVVGRLPDVRTAFPIETTWLVQLSPNPGQSIRTFSHAVPKHCQWKIDGRQNGNDAGPESFELRFFLQGLRQKQHGWGAAWGIQKRFNQRFCIETVLTQKSSQGYCLEDVAILTHGKSSRRERPSCFSSWRWRSRSSPRCSNCISH